MRETRLTGWGLVSANDSVGQVDPTFHDRIGASADSRKNKSNLKLTGEARKMKRYARKEHLRLAVLSEPENFICRCIRQEEPS
jgi:hypothetical protein